MGLLPSSPRAQIDVLNDAFNSVRKLIHAGAREVVLTVTV